MIRVLPQRDCPGVPVVKILSFQCRGLDSIPGQETKGMASPPPKKKIVLKRVLPQHQGVKVDEAAENQGGWLGPFGISQVGERRQGTAIFRELLGRSSRTFPIACCALLCWWDGQG